MLIVNTNTMGERMRHTHAGRSLKATMRVAALAGVLALSGATVVVSPALAGLLMHTSCTNPDGSPAPNEGWSGFTTGTPSTGSTNDTNCGPGKSMYAFLSTQSAAPEGAGEGLQYTPPKGSTLVGGTIHVGLSADGYGARAAGTAALFSPAFSYDAANVFLQCVAVLAPCQNGTTNFYGPVELPRDRGGSLFVAAGCKGQVAGTVCNTGGSHKAWALVGVSYAHLLLSNTTAPSATLFSGSLLSADANGSANLGFTATDEDVGVYRVQVVVDGKTLYDQTPNPNAGKCVPAGTDAASGALIFASQTPCPQSQQVNLAVPTTGLSDGRHELIVNVVDAAQNTGTVLRQTITTNNRNNRQREAWLRRVRGARAGLRDRAGRTHAGADARRAPRLSALGVDVVGDAAYQRRGARAWCGGDAAGPACRRGRDADPRAYDHGRGRALGVACPARSIQDADDQHRRGGRVRVGCADDPPERQAGPVAARQAAGWWLAWLQRPAADRAAGQTAAAGCHPGRSLSSRMRRCRREISVQRPVRRRAC